MPPSVKVRVIAPRQNDSIARIDRSNPANWRVVATRRIPPNTFVAVYPGYVYPNALYEKLLAEKRFDGFYGVYGFRVSESGNVLENCTIDPSLGPGVIDDTFAQSLAPYVNQPSTGQPNLRWVYNFYDETKEYWTSRAVEAGEELTLCYRLDKSPGYQTSCDDAPPDGYILKDTAARPWETMSPADEAKLRVRRAGLVKNLKRRHMLASQMVPLPAFNKPQSTPARPAATARNRALVNNAGLVNTPGPSRVVNKGLVNKGLVNKGLVNKGLVNRPGPSRVVNAGVVKNRVGKRARTPNDTANRVAKRPVRKAARKSAPDAVNVPAAPPGTMNPMNLAGYPFMFNNLLQATKAYFWEGRVRASKNMPSGTYVTTFPGRVVPRIQLKRLVSQGRRGYSYIQPFYRVLPDGRVDKTTWLLDPTVAKDRIAPVHYWQNGNVASFIRRRRDQPGNVGLVFDVSSGDMQVWTTRAVKAGEELVMATTPQVRFLDADGKLHPSVPNAVPPPKPSGPPPSAFPLFAGRALATNVPVDEVPKDLLNFSTMIDRIVSRVPGGANVVKNTNWGMLDIILVRVEHNGREVMRLYFPTEGSPFFTFNSRIMLEHVADAVGSEYCKKFKCASQPRMYIVVPGKGAIDMEDANDYQPIEDFVVDGQVLIFV